MAPRQGWKAIVSQRDDKVYLTPWSVLVENKQCIRIGWRTNRSLNQNSSAATPPSSEKAFELLNKFCLPHDLGSQVFAALAATLTFPTHNHHGTIVKLPFPTDMRGKNDYNQVKRTVSNSVRLKDELPYYMALSCNHNVITSSLCGVFWEPDIPCNLVSPWLHPVMKEVPIREDIMNLTGRYHEILAIMCAIRRPKLSALWLGAVISGLATIILSFVKSGTPPLDPNAFAWTSCPQSFMDLAGSGLYSQTDASDEMIRRVDAWRLLYLPSIVDDDLHYERLPFTPWEPVGATNVQNCVARVRIHVRCPRHRLDYQNWTCQLKDGSKLQDQGFDMQPVQDFPKEVGLGTKTAANAQPPTVAVSLNQDASRAASWEIFQWVVANGEGVPPSEPIYNDEWLRDDTISETSSLPGDGAIDGDKAVSQETTYPILPTRKLKIGSWIDGLPS
ncbi:hypothetical protein MMC17_009792 [Xylographa soralifera]|nr:hypothetical protein [Xylographa soralifera]